MSSKVNIGGYRLTNLMMTGQTSQVWEVVEGSSGRHFAMKLLLPEHTRNPEHRQFLFHEAEVGQRLAHPNIIKPLSLRFRRNSSRERFIAMKVIRVRSTGLRVHWQSMSCPFALRSFT